MAPNDSVNPRGGRRVVIVRHGERVDHRFQDAWVEKSFDTDGNYIPQNLNQPEHLPKRKGFPQTFIRDSPLTEVGLLQATLRGRGIAAAKILQDDFEVYTSPSLRCVQTATNILDAMNVKKELKVEPALFEWTQIQWYLNGNMPKWMETEDQLEAGFKIAAKYDAFIPRADMKEGESVEDLYSRSYSLITHLLKNTDKDMLLVAHGFSLEVLTRQILGFPIRSREELLSTVREIPYCGMLILEEDGNTKKVELVSLPSQLQMKHASAHEFDARTTFC